MVKRKVEEVRDFFNRAKKPQGHSEISDVDASRPKKSLEAFSVNLRPAIRRLGITSTEDTVHLNQLPAFIKNHPEFSNLLRKG